MSAHIVTSLHSKLSTQRRDGAVLLKHVVLEASDSAFHREHARWLSGLLHVLRADDELPPARAAALAALATLVERSSAFAAEARSMASGLQRIMPVQARALATLGAGGAPILRALVDVLDVAGSNLKPYAPRLEAAVLPLLVHEDGELRGAAALLLARTPFILLANPAAFADAWLTLCAKVLGTLDALCASLCGCYDGQGLALSAGEGAGARLPQLELAVPSGTTIGAETDAALSAHDADAPPCDDDAEPTAAARRAQSAAVAAAVLAAVQRDVAYAPPAPSSQLERAELRAVARARLLAHSLCATLCALLQPQPSATGRLCGWHAASGALPAAPMPVRALVRLAARALLAGSAPALAVPPEGAFGEAAAAAALPSLQVGLADVLAALCATAGSAVLPYAQLVGEALTGPLLSLPLARAPGVAAPAGAEPAWVKVACRLLRASATAALALGGAGAAPLGAPTLRVCIDVIASLVVAEAAAARPAAAAADGGGEAAAARGNGGGNGKRRRDSAGGGGGASAAPARVRSRANAIVALAPGVRTRLLVAALACARELLLCAGSAQPAAERLALDRLLLGLLEMQLQPVALSTQHAPAAGAAAGGAAAGGLGGGAHAPAAAHCGLWRQSAAARAAVLDALGASLGSGYAVQPPALSAALPLLAASRRSADAEVASAAARALATAESFMHPRLAPAATPKLAVESWAAVARALDGGGAMPEGEACDRALSDALPRALELLDARPHDRDDNGNARERNVAEAAAAAADHARGPAVAGQYDEQPLAVALVHAHAAHDAHRAQLEANAAVAAAAATAAAASAIAAAAAASAAAAACAAAPTAAVPLPNNGSMEWQEPRRPADEAAPPSAAPAPPRSPAQLAHTVAAPWPAPVQALAPAQHAGRAADAQHDDGAIVPAADDEGDDSAEDDFARGMAIDGSDDDLPAIVMAPPDGEY